jgi:hypothetical protein
MSEITVAFAHSKKRDYFGMVGIEIEADNNTAFVRMAKQWSREQLNQMPQEIKQIYHRVKWHRTFADHQIGLHLIRNFENKLQLGIHTITTQKHLNDAENIDRLQVMDMTEMVQLTLSLKQDRKIQWPAKFSKDMGLLIKQIEMFTENVTEQGTVSYYAPGNELDALPKALMIALFGNRTELQQGFSEMIIKQGAPSITGDSDRRLAQEERMLAAAGFTTVGSLDDASINRMNRNRLYSPREII